MTHPEYVPDEPASFADLTILANSGPEPVFDPVTADFLLEGHFDLKRRCQSGGLLKFASLGQRTPWLYRLDFVTTGLVRQGDGQVVPTNRHVVALRFPHDYLRHADRFAMLRLMEPGEEVFHPNIATVGAMCVEIYPGEPIVEICQSLHDLFRWRLYQLDERDALNPTACAWGRENITEPVDDRSLFGQRVNINWQPSHE